MPAPAPDAAGPARGAPRVDVVLTGLEVPWALAFAPDGRLFITERPGRIRVARDGRLEPVPVATLDVFASGESGLLGLALDPRFGDNGISTSATRRRPRCRAACSTARRAGLPW